jgi:CRP-like cAMP-binding protein
MRSLPRAGSAVEGHRAVSAATARVGHAGSNDREVASIDGIERIEDRAARRFPHGEVIVHQGDASSCLYLVTDGAVRLSSVTAAGREVVIALLRPGDVFGESALLGKASPVEARAVGPTTLVAVPLASLRALIERHPAIAEQLLRLVAARLHRTSTALEEALVGDLPSRILGRLRDLAAGHGVREPEGVRLTVPITQDELARMVGASRESVSRSVGALAARGLVRSERRRMLLTESVVRDGGDPVS